MASMTGTRRIVISTVVLAAASAVFGVIMLASGPMSSAMPGITSLIGRSRTSWSPVNDAKAGFTSTYVHAP